MGLLETNICRQRLPKRIRLGRRLGFCSFSEDADELLIILSKKRESNWKEICVLFLCEVVLVYFLSSGHFRCNGCSSDHVFVEKCVRDDVENVHQWDKPKEINDKKNNIECEYVEAIINNKLISGKKRRRENMCVCFQWRMGGRWDGRALAWTIFFFLAV